MWVKPRYGYHSLQLLQLEGQIRGAGEPDVQRLIILEEGHYRLKSMYINLALDNQLLRDLFSRKGCALPLGISRQS